MLTLLLELIRTLIGQAQRGDIAQDFYGFQALVLRLDPYPVLGPAFATMGIDWPVTHASTHPATAYLLTAPVAFLPWPVASAAWAWLMTASVVASLRLYGLRWKWVALVVLACLVWQPFVYSLGQITPLWLLGTALAYRNQDRPFTAGAWVAFASLTKFLPGLLLIPFILHRKWSSLAGLAAVWLLALALITALHPGAIPRYLKVNQGIAIETILRSDNGALLPTLMRFAGLPGTALGLAFLALITWRGRDIWHVWEFLAVALLPIAWVYSLLPLLPGMVANRRHPLTLVALLLMVAMPPFGPLSALLQSCALLVYGFQFLPKISAFRLNTERALKVQP